MNTNLKYAIALSLLNGVGSVMAKKLIAHAGGYKEVFDLSKKELLKIQGVGIISAASIFSQIKEKKVILRAEKELNFIEKHNLHPILFKSKEYPINLLQCEDAPLVLFCKGNLNLNKKKILSIVGTRKITEYGKYACDSIIGDFEHENILIVSGLAYGVDSYAHKACVEKKIETVGVLAHGLDIIYPAINRKLAQKMCDFGGVITEFLSETNPDRENFPKRNRIIAGLADATLVIESAKKGGSLITAEIANSYNRDVFAVPGKIGEEYSEGCNLLIKNNKAHLVQSAQDIKNLMNWDNPHPKKIQQSLFTSLTPEEELIKEAFSSDSSLHIDQLATRTNNLTGMLAVTLLEMEFKGLIKSLPGKIYQLK